MPELSIKVARSPTQAHLNVKDCLPRDYHCLGLLCISASKNHAREPELWEHISERNDSLIPSMLYLIKSEVYIEIEEKVFTWVYKSSTVPPFPAGNIVITSTFRQSRNQEGRSLRISAICKMF